MVADRNDTWVSCPFVGRTTILSLGRNSHGRCIRPGSACHNRGGQARPRQPHSAPSHISKIVPPTVHLGPLSGYTRQYVVPDVAPGVSQHHTTASKSGYFETFMCKVLRSPDKALALTPGVVVSMGRAISDFGSERYLRRSHQRSSHVPSMRWQRRQKSPSYLAIVATRH